MKIKLAIICLVLAILASNASAFPLTGGNGKVNATVFGVIKEEPQDQKVKIIVDVVSSAYYYNVVLVDDDDNFYNPENFIHDINVGGTDEHGNNSRQILYFTIPRDAIIKRLRFEPFDPAPGMDTYKHIPAERLVPFSIDWAGYPEISGDNITIRFYEANKKKSVGLSAVAWDFTLKITNKGKENLNFRPKDFIIQDQYGWKYNGGGLSGGYETTTLLPDESMKTVVDISGMSPLSRPVKMIYRNSSMDISAWT